MILDGCISMPEKVVKLLGIHNNENFDFSTDTEDICKKAGRQLSAMSRLYSNNKAKLALFILSHFQY